MAESGAQAGPAGSGKLWHSLYLQVLVAIVAGVALGAFAPSAGAAMKPFADIFIRLVKMVISPVIFLTMVTGIAGLGDLRRFGRITAKAFIYFLTFSTLALVIGFAVATLVQPGAGMNVSVASLNAASVADYAAKARAETFVGFITDIVPATLSSSLVDGNILQVLLVAILVGVALAMTGRATAAVRELLQQASTIVFRIVAMVMRIAPVGAFGAMAFTIGKFGVASLVNLASLVACFYATSLFFVVVVLGAVARYNGFSLWRLVVYLRAELLLVLGTSSSEAALPALMARLERAGCDKGVVGLVVPTGYSFNLDGTNIYMTLAALFIAQACNIHLSLGQQILLLAVAMVSSKGAAGVTGAGFITLAATLTIVPSMPVAGMALILGIDRFMSECRSLTNFIGNAVATIVIARWEGGLDRQALDDVLKPVKSVPSIQNALPAE